MSSLKCRKYGAFSHIRHVHISKSHLVSRPTILLDVTKRMVTQHRLAVKTAFSTNMYAALRTTTMFTFYSHVYIVCYVILVCMFSVWASCLN